MNTGEDISQQELLKHIKNNSNICILDVRSAQEYSTGYVPGALNIGHKEISSRLDELESFRDEVIVVYCERGVRARIAQKALLKAGFESVFHLTGDMEDWRNAELTMEKPGVGISE